MCVVILQKCFKKNAHQHCVTPVEMWLTKSHILFPTGLKISFMILCTGKSLVKEIFTCVREFLKIHNVFHNTRFWLQVKVILGNHTKFWFLNITIILGISK